MAHEVQFSVEEPSNPSTGKIWIKPDNGTIWKYMVDQWLPVGADDAIEFSYPLTIFIRGENRTAACEVASFRKVDAITSEPDTLDFTLYDKSASINPVQGEEIMVFKKASAGATPVKWFGGEITYADPQEEAPGQLRFIYAISCRDYTARLDKELATTSYEDSSCETIIDGLIDTFANEFSTFGVQTGPTISKVVYNYKRISECLEELAKKAGYEWYVDYERDIHFFYKSTYTAPYSLTEVAATTGHYRDLLFQVDKSQLRNRVTVRGGIYISSELHTQYAEADGEQTSFQLDYKPRTPITAYVDTGGGYVEKTIGADGINTSGYDFVVNYSEKLLKNLDLATLTAGHILKVTYKREIRVIAQYTDWASVQALRDIEGGNGYYEHYIEDESAETVDAALEVAKADSAEFSNAVVSGSFTTDQTGYRSGQLLTVNLPTWQYGSKTYIIQRVTSRLREDGTTFEYDIEFAGRLKGLSDLLIALLDSSRKITIREDETTHRFISGSDESISVSETDPTSTLFTPPYKWGADADQGKWNEAQWG